MKLYNRTKNLIVLLVILIITAVILMFTFPDPDIIELDEQIIKYNDVEPQQGGYYFDEEGIKFHPIED
jgi:hypothetical protein